jgi:hypothetical protein
MKKTLLISILSICIFAGTIFSSAWLVLQCEQYAIGSNIHNYSDALWWSLNVSSVGDTDFQPVTMLGRTVGAITILIGATQFSLTTGLLAAIFSYFIKKELNINE